MINPNPNQYLIGFFNVIPSQLFQEIRLKSKNIVSSRLSFQSNGSEIHDLTWPRKSPKFNLHHLRKISTRFKVTVLTSKSDIVQSRPSFPLFLFQLFFVKMILSRSLTSRILLKPKGFWFKMEKMEKNRLTSGGNGRQNAQNYKTIINTIYMKLDFPITKKNCQKIEFFQNNITLTGGTWGRTGKLMPNIKEN